MKKILSALCILIVILVVIILVRTLLFTKSIPHTKASSIPALNTSSIEHLSKAIQIKTVSLGNAASIDSAEFLKFRNFLDSTFPLICQQLQRSIIDSFSYVYYWKGKTASLQPYIFLAHSDIVPVEPSSLSLWHVDPFSGTVKDSAVWGRGAFDDKGCLIALFEAVENLLQQHYVPERDIYLCFGHDEELGGERGAKQIVQWLQQKNIHAALAMDEGGIITKENFKELNRPIGLIGVSEKGSVSFELTVEKEGGHSSMPDKETAIDILAKAVYKLRQQQMPVHFAEPTNIMLEKIGPGMPFTTRMALANRWLFESMLISQFEKSNGTNATIHTTIVPTILESGIKENVVPSVAKATVNSRIMPGETSADVLSFIRKTINDERVKIKQLSFHSEPSKMTSAEGEAYKKVEKIAYETLDDIVPVPFLLIGASDSRYYDTISDAVMRFLPVIDPKGFHGVDEKISFTDFNRMIYFYTLMITSK